MPSSHQASILWVCSRCQQTTQPPTSNSWHKDLFKEKEPPLPTIWISTNQWRKGIILLPKKRRKSKAMMYQTRTLLKDLTKVYLSVSMMLKLCPISIIIIVQISEIIQNPPLLPTIVWERRNCRLKTMGWRSCCRNSRNIFTKGNSSHALISFNTLARWKKFLCLPQKNNSLPSLETKFSIEKWPPHHSSNL